MTAKKMSRMTVRVIKFISHHVKFLLVQLFHNIREKSTQKAKIIFVKKFGIYQKFRYTNKGCTKNTLIEHNVINIYYSLHVTIV